MPRVPVAQLRYNMALRKHPFLLREKSASTTRGGSAMLRVMLADRSGTIPGVFFDVPAHVVESLSAGHGVEVTGRIGEYKGQLQMQIEQISPVELAPLEEYLPAAARPLPEMKREFDELLKSVTNADLTRLLNAVFGDPEVYRAFTESPAAKYHHHACVGGLLQHTLSVVRLVLACAELYSELDHDLVLAAALLHDLGKTRAYDPISFDLTEEGALWTHLYMSASWVERIIAGLPGFDADLALRLVHAILAHHGELEHGSPVRPMTLEAIVLHNADDLDAHVQGALDQFERSLGEGEAFTEVSPMHDTRLYRGPGEPSSPSQRPLW